MKNKIWEFAEDTELVETPHEILDKYASKLKEDTVLIEGRVTELISESRDEIIYALYLVVPELKNYSYRLVEVVEPNAFTFYPVQMKLYGNPDGKTKDATADNADDFEKKLIGFIENPVTKGILFSIKKHIDNNKKHSIE